jgi:putative FmdB family regulatory protein
MPTYQYRCAKCGEEFELWQSIHDDALTRHPGCGGTVTKVFAPAGIVLKGSGFYRTDSRAAARKGSDGAKEKEKEKEPAKDGAAAGNGSGGEAKGPSDSKDSTSSKESKDTKKEAKPSKSGSSST